MGTRLRSRVTRKLSPGLTKPPELLTTCPEFLTLKRIQESFPSGRCRFHHFPQYFNARFLSHFTPALSPRSRALVSIFTPLFPRNEISTKGNRDSIHPLLSQSALYIHSTTFDPFRADANRSRHPREKRPADQSRSIKVVARALSKH